MNTRRNNKVVVKFILVLHLYTFYILQYNWKTSIVVNVMKNLVFSQYNLANYHKVYTAGGRPNYTEASVSDFFSLMYYFMV